jgi:hypothetical protein
MRCEFVRGMLACALLLSLADCANAPQPPPPPMPVVHKEIQAHWIFAAGGACTATVATALLSLDIIVSPREIDVSVRLSSHRGLPRNGTRIDFVGASGSWSVTAHGPSRHKATATEPMSPDAAGRVFVLLSGGILHFGEPEDGLLALRVPDGGAPARLWFECVRHDLRR